MKILCPGRRYKLEYLAMMWRGMAAWQKKNGATRPSGPLFAQVQTVDRCNASCLMCPYASAEQPAQSHRMDPGLYTRILKELQKAGSLAAFTPMLQNEPLLDGELATRIQQAKKILGPKVRVWLVTNGSLLSAARARELMEAGLDSISVSLDAYREETFRAIHRGLSYKKVTANVRHLLKEYPQAQVIARFLRQEANRGEERDFARYWKSQGAGVHLHEVVNRGGALPDFDRLRASRPGQARLLLNRTLHFFFPYCPLPFFAMTIRWNGQVVLCCHDWQDQSAAGDLKKQSLKEVWNGSKMNRFRAHLRKESRETLQPCGGCSLRRGYWSGDFYCKA